MKLLKMVSSTYESVTRLAKLELVLAAVCILIPVILVVFDGGTVRGSISAYYNMTQNQVFYFLLTVASMLFIVNGVVKQKHVYNIVLGVMLAGATLFNHKCFAVVHNISAAGFFVGNAAVIVIFSPKKELRFKISLVVIIAASMAAWLLGVISLFWAESASLVTIGFHFILESLGVID